MSEFSYQQLVEAASLVYSALDLGEDHTTLQRIVMDELIATHKVMERSPDLQAKGEMIDDSYLAPEFDGFPIREDERWGDYLDRVEAENERRSEPLVQPILTKQVKYWKLTSTDFVYTEDQWVARLIDSELRYVSLNFVAKPELEIIIQDLRLLRTPFNGAVVT